MILILLPAWMALNVVVLSGPGAIDAAEAKDPFKPAANVPRILNRQEPALPTPPGQGQAASQANQLAPASSIPATSTLAPSHPSCYRCRPTYGSDNRFGEYRGGWRGYSIAPRYRGSSRGYRR